MTVASEQLLLYGLRIESELPLHQNRWVPRDEPPDVIIRVGEPMASTDHPPPGHVLFELEVGRRLYCATSRDDGRYVLRCHRTCDFVIDAGLRDVTVHVVSGADPELASVLVTGTLLSFLLELRGHVVLHASAVDVGGVAVAFVGATGMGKSTMAALMCADGAALVTDDVLRLDVDDSDRAPTCHAGATELRLRKAAGHLASRFIEPVGTRRTVDGRVALQLSGATRPGPPLAGIIIPVPDHGGARRTPEVERLDTMNAMLTLLRFPRLLGWRDRPTINRHFHQLADVVGRVSVHVVNMPWGPPFPDGIAAAVLGALGIDHPSTSRAGEPGVRSGPPW